MAQVPFPGVEPHHLSVSGHAVAAAHIEELEGLTTIHKYTLVIFGGRKKEEDWQQMLAKGESSPAKKKKSLEMHGWGGKKLRIIISGQNDKKGKSKKRIETRNRGFPEVPANPRWSRTSV